MRRLKTTNIHVQMRLKLYSGFEYSDLGAYTATTTATVREYSTHSLFAISVSKSNIRLRHMQLAYLNAQSRSSSFDSVFPSDARSAAAERPHRRRAARFPRIRVRLILRIYTRGNFLAPVPGPRVKFRARPRLPPLHNGRRYRCTKAGTECIHRPERKENETQTERGKRTKKRGKSASRLIWSM